MRAAMKGQQARAASGCCAAAATPPEKVVMIWMAAGNAPTMVMPWTWISSLSC
jgi:hypothetical protein